MSNINEIEKAKRRLKDLATWTPKQLNEELAKWTPEEVTNLWTLLEKPFRQMCRGFGLASKRQKMSQRGIYTHRQIKRLTVLQRHATGVNFNVGDIIYASWGYDQTQYDFAQIVEISKTRKTIKAQIMKTKRVDTTRTSDVIVPTEAYGKEFRLWVREGWRGQPAFVGRYPFINGNHDSKRSGCFTHWEGSPVYETNSQFGH